MFKCPAQPPKEDILRLLDTEIDDLSNQQTQAGYSTWVIAAAATGLLWKILDVVERGAYDLSTSLVLFLWFSLGWDVLSYILSASRPFYDLQTPSYRFHNLGDLRDPVSPLFELIRSLVVLVLVVLLRNVLSPVATWGLCIYYFCSIVGCGCVLLFESVRIRIGHTASAHESRKRNFRAALLFFVSILFIVFTYEFVDRNILYLRVADVKFSGLLFGEMLLGEFLASVLRKPASMYSLIRIRRDLLSETIHPTRANELLQKSLRGLSFAQAWEEKYDYLLSSLRIISADVDRMSDKVPIISTIVNKKPIDKNILRTECAEVQGLLAEQLPNLKRFRYKVRSQRLLLLWYGLFMNADEKNSIQSKYKTIADKLRIIFRQVKEIRSGLVVIQKYTEKLTPATQR